MWKEFSLKSQIEIRIEKRISQANQLVERIPQCKILKVSLLVLLKRRCQG